MEINLGENLKSIRKTKNLTVDRILTSLSEKGLKVSRSTYYSWEEGNRQIPHKYILPLCLILNITIDFLYVANNKSELFQDKLKNVESIKNFLCNLDDDLCKMLIGLERHWQGDLKAALIMLGIYSAQPVDMRRDVSDLCLHNFLCAVNDGEADKEIAEKLDIEYYKKALEKLYK